MQAHVDGDHAQETEGAQGRDRDEAQQVIPVEDREEVPAGVGVPPDGEDPPHHELDPEEDQEGQVDLPEVADQVSVEVELAEVVDGQQGFEIFVEERESLRQLLWRDDPIVACDLGQLLRVVQVGRRVTGHTGHAVLDAIKVLCLARSFERVFDQNPERHAAQLFELEIEALGAGVEEGKLLRRRGLFDQLLGERVGLDPEHRVPNPRDDGHVREIKGSQPEVGEIEEDQAEVDQHHPHHEEIPQGAEGDFPVLLSPLF